MILCEALPSISFLPTNVSVCMYVYFRCVMYVCIYVCMCILDVSCMYVYFRFVTYVCMCLCVSMYVCVF